MTPLDDPGRADAALVIEAMLQVAADPVRWEQLVEALGEVPASDAAPAAVQRGLDRSAEFARLVRAPDAEPAPAGRGELLGWVALSDRGRALDANPLGRAALAAGLGRLVAGQPIAFDDPHNLEAFERGLAQIQGRPDGRVVLRFDRPGDEGPSFAYLVGARTLAPEIGAGRDPEPAFALVFPAAEAADRLWLSLKESFGLTPAELRLASRLRDGRALKDAADELGVSINTVRNQLRAIFDKMGLRRQSDLVRALAELAQLSAALADRAPPRAGPEIRTLRLADGRLLAYREHGDPGGRAVLLFHEGLGSSLMPPGYHELSAQLGLRVICAERPGFGQSDPRPAYSFDGVAEDMVEVCDRLGMGSVRLAGVLSGAPSAICTARRLGSRAERLILVSARPPRPIAPSRANNPLTLFRARIENHPWVIETVFAIMKQRASPATIARMVRSATEGSPNDRAFMDANPWAAEFVSAYVREALARSTRGPADEVKAFRRAGNSTAADLTCPLTVWHGEDDQLSPLPELLDYLGATPAELKLVPGIGHTLALKHWREILRDMAA